MNIHKNARLTLHGRDLLVRRMLDGGLRPEEAAQASGVSVRTAYKWLRRFREEGDAGLHDRSSRPKSCPHALPTAIRAQVIEQRRSSQTYRQISQQCGFCQSTIGRWLNYAGLNRLAALEPAAPIVSYEHPAPGDMLHLDIKKLGSFHRPGHRGTADRTQASHGAGWEFVHVALDDNSRVAFAEIQPDESDRSACQALLAALRYYRQFGVTFRRILTDNGACYKSRRFARLCQRLGLRHRRTKPYTPQTNGKAERFIQTALREGPTREPMSPPSTVLSIYRSGCITTTGTDLIPAFNISRQSPASPYSTTWWVYTSRKDGAIHSSMLKCL